MEYGSFERREGVPLEHVDLYRISVANRQTCRLATVSLGDSGWKVEADEPLRAQILARIEQSPFAPGTLDDLAFVFDVPQLMATRPHVDTRCPFGKGDIVALQSVPPSLKLDGGQVDRLRTRA
jgi:hypothetical protein